MPPKNIRKKKWLMEQKKIIASKLMKISLKLDDYIYKNKPISIQEAKTYAEEIDQLKIKCTDVRSLQVSEKLTSIVKSIIGKQYSNEITSDVDTNTPLQINEDSEVINQKNQINHISEQTINIENVSQPDKEHEINETSSNLNIPKDVDTTMAAVNIIQCEDRAENISVITTTENLNVDINHTSAPIGNVSEDIQSEEITTEMNNDNINLNKIDDNTSISINMETNNICKTCNKISIQLNEETIINKVNNIVKESDNINVSSTITNINDQLNNKPICDNKSNPSEKKCQEMISQNPKPKKKTVSKKNDKMATNVKALNEKTNKNNTKPITNLKAPAKKSKKKKEIMDLSWIENIKYVREINTDEHIVTNLQESFWTNLTMPAISNIDFDAE